MPAELPLTVEALIVIVPLVEDAAASQAELPLMVEALIVTVPSL